MNDDVITENQARRSVEWDVTHGRDKHDAYEHLAYIMNATVEQLDLGKKKEDAPTKK